MNEHWATANNAFLGLGFFHKSVSLLLGIFTAYIFDELKIESMYCIFSLYQFNDLFFDELKIRSHFIGF